MFVQFHTSYSMFIAMLPLVVAQSTDGALSSVIDAADTANTSLLDAVNEAASTLCAFLVAVVIIQVMKSRHHNNLAAKVKARKLAKLSMDVPPTSVSTPSVAPPQLQPPKQQLQRPSQGEVLNSASATRPAPVAQTRQLHPRPAATQRGARTPPNHNLESDALAAAVRGGRAGDLPRLLDAARQRAMSAGGSVAQLQDLAAQQLLSALRACASRRCFWEALAAYDCMAFHIGDGCSNTWSLLLYSAVEAKEFWRCEVFFERLCQNGVPSSNDFVNMVRFHAFYERDVVKMKDMFASLRRTDFKLDVIGRNRALSVCTSAKALDLAEALADAGFSDAAMDTVGYNTLMKGCSQNGDPARCLSLYAKMQSTGLVPSEMSFGIVLDACIDARNLDFAQEVFEDLRKSGLQMNVVHYTTFMKGLALAGRLKEATHVLDEMAASPDTKPDLVTYSTLVKAHADFGKVMEAIRLLERMSEQGIVPDAIIYNIVLTGCTVNPMDPAQIMHVYKWLSRHGLHTTTATMSILVKALARSNALDAALELLNNAPSKFKVWPEARLYAQLAQACAHVGEHGKALDCYTSLVKSAAARGVAIDEPTNSRLYRLCASSSKSVAASKIYRAVTEAGGYLAADAIDELLRVTS